MREGGFRRDVVRHAAFVAPVEFVHVGFFEGEGPGVGFLVALDVLDGRPVFQDAPERREGCLGDEELAQGAADVGDPVLGGVDGVEGFEGVAGVCEGHVDFEEELGGDFEGFGCDVGFAVHEGNAVGVEGEVEDEPHALQGC